MSTIKVYKDKTDPNYHIGIRDDGAETCWSSSWEESYWKFMGNDLAWEKDIGLCKDCGELLFTFNTED